MAIVSVLEGTCPLVRGNLLENIPRGNGLLALMIAPCSTSMLLIYLHNLVFGGSHDLFDVIHLLLSCHLWLLRRCNSILGPELLLLFPHIFNHSQAGRHLLLLTS